MTHNQSITIHDLPAGTEVDHGITVTIPAEVGGQSQRLSIDFTNNRGTPAPEYGNLEVVKTVTDSAGDTKTDFNFRVELSDTDIDGIYGDMTSVNGTAEFTLKHNERKSAIGLPAGITYKVMETQANQNGYTTMATGSTGTVPANDTAKAKFVNNKSNNLSNPSKTGDNSRTDRWIALMFASLICGAVCFFSIKKNKITAKCNSL